MSTNFSIMQYRAEQELMNATWLHIVKDYYNFNDHRLLPHKVAREQSEINDTIPPKSDDTETISEVNT